MKTAVWLLDASATLVLGVWGDRREMLRRWRNERRYRP